MAFEIDTQWIHVKYEEASSFAETYGFSGTQNMVNLEGVLMKPKGVSSDTLLVFMHPSSTLQLLPVPRAAVAAGSHVLCAGSRYARNDSALIYEKVLLDLAAYIRHAKAHWGYEKIILVGWSGGGSLALFYQSEAEHPSITHIPAGDVVDIKGAELIPADALIFQAAHVSRPRLLLDAIDPSIQNELDPDDRNVALDIYDPRNSNQPPYSKDFIDEYRRAQVARMRKITAWVKDTLNTLKRRKNAEMERSFVTHRTMAEPRFLDPTLDPNDRRPGWCYLGNPETANNGPVGLGRFSTLRSWLSQWSIDNSRADGIACAKRVSAPILVIENSADDAVPQPHPGMVYQAAKSADKEMEIIKGGTHYYAGQPDHLAQVTAMVRNWLLHRGLGGVI